MKEDNIQPSRITKTILQKLCGNEDVQVALDTFEYMKK